MQNRRMKTQYTPVIGIDFIDEHGIRFFNFSLCSHGSDGFKARALVDMQDAQVYRIAVIPELSERRKAIARMARNYQHRSIPQRFFKTA